MCEILSLPQDDLRKQFLHPKVESSKRIKQYDSQTSLKYQRNVKAWGSTARDMSVLIHVRTLKNEEIALVVSSMETDLVPKVPECIRMKVLSAGWILQPAVGKDGTKGTRAIYVNHCDVIRGWVPLSLVKKALKDTLGQLHRLRKIVLDMNGNEAKNNGTHGDSLKKQKLAQLDSAVASESNTSNSSSSNELGPMPVPRQSVESRQVSMRRHRNSALGVDDSCCSVFTPSPKKKPRR